MEELKRPTEWQELKKLLLDVGSDESQTKAAFDWSKKNREAYAEDLKSLSGYCIFIGYPRSGHSLIASALDAHSEMVVAHELHVLKFLDAGFDRNQITFLLLENSRLFAKFGRIWNSYNYAIPDQWQGKFQSLKIVGDKRGGGTSWWISESPDMLERMVTEFTPGVKFIHVIRNPFDSLATIKLRQRNQSDPVEAFRFFFRLCDTNSAIGSQLPAGQVLDIYHEDFVSDPKGQLKRLCSFLGIMASPEYLESCASIVFEKPHRSRHDATWTDGAIKIVEKNAELRFPG